MELTKKNHIKELRKLGYHYRTMRPLNKVEAEMHTHVETFNKWAEALEAGKCSQKEFDDKQIRYEDKCFAAVKRVEKLFGGELPDNFQISGDPDGYALLINQGGNRVPLSLVDGYGFGVLAPEFDEVQK